MLTTDFLGGELCHGAAAVAEQEAVETPAVGIGQGAEDALVSVDACEENRLLAALVEVVVQGLLGRPHSARTVLVKVEVVEARNGKEGVVELGTPAALP